MWWNRSMPTRRAASSSDWVPSTLVRKKRPGSTMARLLCDSAAKFTMTSIACPRRTRSQSSRSTMSPCSNAMRPSRSSRFARLPAYVSRSSTITSSSGWRSTQYRVKFEPMNPAPPVTSTRTSGPEAEVRLASGVELGAPWVALVALGEHRVGDTPIGESDLGVVPRHAELVLGVVVPVDEIRDRHVGERDEGVGDARGDVHAAVVVGAVVAGAEVEVQGGAVGGGADPEVVQHDAGAPRRDVPVVRLVHVVVEADDAPLLTVAPVALHHLEAARDPLPPVGLDEETAFVLVDVRLDDEDAGDRLGFGDGRHYLFAP